MIPISLRGREVTAPDMDRCADVASVIRLPFDREIVHKVIHNYSVDDQPWIKNPLGLYASRLACEVYVVTCEANHKQNINKCVNNSGYDVRDVVYSGMADASGLLDTDDGGKTVIVLDIGSDLTELSVFTLGCLNDIDIITTGSSDIKGDPASSVAMNEIILRIEPKVRNITESDKRAPKIILTGGMAFADGLIEHMEDRLSCPIKMGVVKDIRGEISGLDSVRLSTALGLARFAYSGYRRKITEEGNIAKRIRERVVDIFNYYF